MIPQRFGFRSWLGLLNYCVLQWFGIRLAREIDDAGRHVRFLFVRMKPGDGWTGRRSQVLTKESPDAPWKPEGDR